MKMTVDCPIDLVTVNGNHVRLTAAFVCLFAVTSILWQHWSIAAFLCIDFLLRSSDKGNISPLSRVGGLIVNRFTIGNAPVDRAPKRFAARIGLLFSIALLVAMLMRSNSAAILLSSVLVVFSFLESALNFCAGCYVYTFLKRLGLSV